MNIEIHITNAKNSLDQARRQISQGKYHTAIQSLATAYANVRELLEQTYKLDHEAKKASSPAGEDTG